MDCAGKEVYIHFIDFLADLINDRAAATKVIEVFILAEIPLQSFIKTVSLYKKIFLKSLLFTDSRKNFNMEYREPDLDNFECLGSWNNEISGSKINKRIINSSKIPYYDLKYYFNDPYLILISCCIISCKYFRDISFTNDSWENITRIDVVTLNKSERTSLVLLDHILDYPDENEISEKLERILYKEKFIANFRDPHSYENSRKRLRNFFKKVFCLKG